MASITAMIIKFTLSDTRFNAVVITAPPKTNFEISNKYLPISFLTFIPSSFTIGRTCTTEFRFLFIVK